MGRPGVSTVAQEGRDAVRPSQTHSQTRSAATPRAKGCPRRIPPRSNRPEPQEDGKADPNAKSSASLRTVQRDHLCQLIAEPSRSVVGLLQQNRPETDMTST